jgi:hypothetical protein
MLFGRVSWFFDVILASMATTECKSKEILLYTPCKSVKQRLVAPSVSLNRGSKPLPSTLEACMYCIPTPTAGQGMRPVRNVKPWPKTATTGFERSYKPRTHWLYLCKIKIFLYGSNN